MIDAFGNDLSVGDYVAVVLNDWPNNQHLAQVLGGGKRIVSIAVKIYDMPEEKRSVTTNCIVRVDKQTAIRTILAR